MNRKQEILETLDAWVNQRPGLDPREYGCDIEGWRSTETAAYRRELATIRRDLHDYRTIRNEITRRDSITADDIIAAFPRAFSGRLELRDISAHYDDGSTYYAYKLDYCVGQYWPTEYRKAATAVLVSAWWEATRKDCPDFETNSKGDFIDGNPGQWMRATARNTFGRGFQQAWCA